MSTLSDLIELAHHAGSAIGAGGGVFAVRLYVKITEAAKSAKAAREAVDALRIEVAKLVADVSKLDSLAATKEWVLNEIQRLLRSSAPAFGGDELIKHRLNEIERRLSGIEDQRDSDWDRSREWNEEIKGTLGEILGMMKMPSRRD